MIAQVIDSTGVCGSIVHYSLVIMLVGCSMILFLYLWRKGKLDMDEGPKYQMMNDDNEENGNERK